MFIWDVLKRVVQKSVWFCFGNLPMLISFYTDPSLDVTAFEDSFVTTFVLMYVF